MKPRSDGGNQGPKMANMEQKSSLSLSDSGPEHVRGSVIPLWFLRGQYKGRRGSAKLYTSRSERRFIVGRTTAHSADARWRLSNFYLSGPHARDPGGATLSAKKAKHDLPIYADI